MKLYLYHLLLLLPVFINTNTFGQEKEMQITQSKKFTLYHANDGGNISLNLKATYYSNGDTFTIARNDERIFGLSSPLSLKAFRDSLTCLLIKEESPDEIFSEYSINEIFLWLYMFRIDNSQPNIGFLNLGTITNLDENNSPARVVLLDSIRNVFNHYRTVYAINKQAMTAQLQQVQKKIAAENMSEPAAKAAAPAPKPDAAKGTSKNKKTTNAPGNTAAIKNKETGTNNPTKTTTGNVTNNAGKDSTKAKKDTTGKATDTPGKDSTSPKKDTTVKGTKATKDADLKVLDHVIRQFTDEAYPIVDSNALSSILINASNTPKEDTAAFSRYQKAKQKITEIIDTMRAHNIYPIEKISVQFERGYIERIQVWVRNNMGGQDIYENTYAIGFTSINNLKAFQSTRLFLRKSSKIGFKGNIFLSDALGNYDNLLDLYTRDYSPADTVVNFVYPDETPVISLKKQQNVQLFDGKIYTDLGGIDQQSPNGLVQLEICRRFNLNTYRWPSRAREDWSFLAYLNAYGALTKIEEKNRVLPLRNQKTVINGTLVSPSYTTNLDLRRYENYSMGIDLNAFLYDYPDMKFTAYVDLGVRYGHIVMGDSTRNIVNGAVVAGDDTTFAGHTVTFMLPKLTLEIFQERRVGLQASYSYNHTIALSNNQFKQIMSYKKSNLEDIATEKAARNSHLFEMLLRVEISDKKNAQMFIRSRFFWQKGDANTFFSQIQVGYAYNLIYRNN